MISGAVEILNKFTYMKDREFKNKREFIGASDLATLMLLNLPNSTPMDFYRVFKGLDEGFKGNRLTDSGNFLEPMILGKAYILPKYGYQCMNDFITSRLWGEDVFKGKYNGVNVELHSFTEAIYPGNPRFVAHADLLDLTDKENPIVVQAKNTGEYAASQRKKNLNKGYDRKDLSENGIPLSVYYQEQWEMLCYGVPVSHVAVCIGGNDWKCYGQIDYDKERCDNLVTASVKMLECIDTNTPPTPTVWKDVIALNPDLELGTKRTVDGDDELNVRKILSELGVLSEKSKTLLADKNDRINAIGLYIGKNEYLMDQIGEVLASAYEKDGQWRVSYSKLKENKELYEAALKVPGLISQDKSSRQLSVKGTNQGSLTKWTMIVERDDKKIKSRKKYTSEEKKQVKAIAKTLKIDIEWERYL